MAEKDSTPLPPRVQNIIGNRYNRWTVLAFSHMRNRVSYWVCQCDCGTIRIHRKASLISISCGCFHKEELAIRNTTHGLARSPEYGSWCAMKDRCQRQKSLKYPRYGGRGIIVCERWQNFENFIADMGPKPTPDYTIERIDNNGNYEPGNCIWVLPEKQASNRSNNHLVTIDGVTFTIAEWRRHFGISKAVFDYRAYQAGWSYEDALTTPVKHIPKHL